MVMYNLFRPISLASRHFEEPCLEWKPGVEDPINEEELFPRWLAEAKYIRAFSQSGNCVYIGTPERDQSAQEILANLEVDEALPNRQGAYA
jgi:hypothetical protein